MDINVTSPKAVKELLRQYNIAPLKRYGQNFLIDGNIADKIACAAAPEGASVLEIGPGLGALSARLVKKASVVAAYEIDAGLVRALSDMFSDTDNLALFHEDFLKADIGQQLSKLLSGEIYVAANLPYYITSPCIMKLVTAKLNIKKITVMVQKEVAERICAAPGNAAYGAISAAIGFYADPKLLFSVSPSCFFPRPEVSSAVLTLDMHGLNKDGADDYLKTVKALFAMRRKTVMSNLRQGFKLEKQDAEAVLFEAGVDENARAETLSVTDFIKLSKSLKKYAKK